MTIMVMITMQGVGPRVLYTLGEHSTTKLYP